MELFFLKETKKFQTFFQQISVGCKTVKFSCLVIVKLSCVVIAKSIGKPMTGLTFYPNGFYTPIYNINQENKFEKNELKKTFLCRQLC